MSQQEQEEIFQSSNSDYSAQTVLDSSSILENNSATTPQYIAQFHTTNWYCQERALPMMMEPSCLKYELDHLYLKREYVRVLELIFFSVGLNETHQGQNHADDDIVLKFIFRED